MLVINQVSLTFRLVLLMPLDSSIWAKQETNKTNLRSKWILFINNMIDEAQYHFKINWKVTK